MRIGATMRRGAGAMMDRAETTRSECAKAWDSQSLPASRRLQAGRTGWRTHEPPTAAACARGAPASTRHSLRRGAACKPTPTCSGMACHVCLSVSARSGSSRGRRGEATDATDRPVSRWTKACVLLVAAAAWAYMEVAELKRSRFSPSRILHVAQSGRTCVGSR
jgi:hypothetical protein